jgi:hypothetical protein
MPSRPTKSTKASAEKGAVRSAEPAPSELAVPAHAGGAAGAAGMRVAATRIFGPVDVALQRSDVAETDDQILWAAIRNRTEAVGFENYEDFLERVFCPRPDGVPPVGDTTGEPKVERLQARLERHREIKSCLTLPSTLLGVNAYRLLKVATEAFLLLECGIAVERSRDPNTGQRTGNFVGLEESRFTEPITPDQIEDRLNDYLVDHLGSGVLPYLDRIIDNLNLAVQETESPFCNDVLPSKVGHPCLLELIWSYWHEEGMLVQAINAISLRFQNKRGRDGSDPLAALAIDPLRPANNLLWGYIQDERDRLSVGRRAYEYSNHYGLDLVGRAVPKLRPADRRSKFLEAFHNLLHRTSIFYQEDADTTVIAQAFPLLNALKEVHMLLAEGAHNQYGDLPWTARVEMLIQEWLLSRREIQEFLRGRAMVPYKEAWMGQVDTMNRLQAWTQTPVTHYRDLGVFGEQILLSVRFGDWVDVNDEANAANWARYWKPEIQGYMHAYRAVTGVDLANPDTVDYTLPSVHLSRRTGRKKSA